MKEKELRAIIRESILDSLSAYDPVDGLTGLMQEYEVPFESRRRMIQALHRVNDAKGGPLDFSYEAEKVVGTESLPEDFYSRAINLVRSRKSEIQESKKVYITRRQISLILRESFNDAGVSVLTEAELNEIAPFLAALGKIGKSVGSFLSKGAKSVASKFSVDPNIQKTVLPMLQKSADKLPNVKKYMDAVGIDLEKPDFNEIGKMFSNEKLTGELDKMLKQGSDQIEKAEECDCPTMEELQKAKDEVS